MKLYTVPIKYKRFVPSGILSIFPQGAVVFIIIYYILEFEQFSLKLVKTNFIR